MELQTRKYEVIYKILKYLIEEKLDSCNIYDILMKIFHINHSEILKIKPFIEYVLNCDYSDVYLQPEDVLKFEKIPYFLSHYYFHKSLDLEDLFFKLQECCEKYNDCIEIKKHFIYITSLVFAIEYKSNNCNDDYFISKFLFVLFAEEYIYQIEEEKIELVEYALSLDIKEYIKNELIGKLYYLNNLNVISDLMTSNLLFRVIPYIVYPLFSKNKDCFTDDENIIFDIDLFSKKNINIFADQIINIISSLSPREEKIIILRYGLNNEKPNTLEEVGNYFNVTRENIRQIEKKALTRLMHPLRILKYQDDIKRYYEAVMKEKEYITFSEMERFFSDKYVNYYIFVFEILDLVKYNYKYNIIYISELKYEQVLNNILETLEESITYDEFATYPEEIQVIIKNNYRELKQGYYKHAINKSKIVAKILDERFNRKFSVKNNDLDKINLILQDEYYIEESFKLHAFRSLLTRINYFPIGNGVYIHLEDLPIISDELLVKIVDFINNLENAISYSSLFEEFKLELEEVGIDNQYCLKSVIDLLLVDDFKITKDYIYKNETSLNARDYLITSLRSINGPFEYRDLREKFPQYSTISINLTLAKEVENGLIIYEPRKYIYIKDIQISSEVKEQLLNILDKKIKEFEGVVSINNIYVDLYYYNEEILEKLGIFNNSYALFSVMKGIFSDKYNFRRPLIFDNSYEDMNVITLLNSKLSIHNEISFNDINEMLQIQAISRTSSRDKLIDYLVESFILVDENKFVNRKLFNISSIILSDIKLIINLILKREKEIDTSTFEGYNLFPKIRYKWNKYLLVGIIKVFLNEEYELKYLSTNGTRDFNYVIRRLINE